MKEDKTSAFEVREARAEDVAQVSALYEAVLDKLEKGKNWPGWRRGFYPTPQTAQEAFDAGVLYVAWVEEKVAGSFVLVEEQEPQYALADWRVDLPAQRVRVLHTFMVHPAYAGQGMGSCLLRAAQQQTVQQGAVALRLDVFEKNEPAIHRYEQSGFAFIGTVDLGLGDVGLPLFRLYQWLAPEADAK